MSAALHFTESTIYAPVDVYLGLDDAEWRRRAFAAVRCEFDLDEGRRLP